MSKQTNNTSPTQKVKNKRFSSVGNMPSQYPELGWTLPTYRWLIFNRTRNGFNCCLMKVGKRWVISMDAFESWLEQHELQLELELKLEPSRD